MGYFALVIRAIGVLEGIALVGNPNFAIIDEAYPYIARRLMTDDSPRLKAALRYMIYGREDSFDAENVIDLLQALEKFTAVRDDGDGSAYKVDGVRGSKVVGTAGDFVGSQIVDTSDRDTDVGDGKFRVSTANGSNENSQLVASNINSGLSQSNLEDQSEQDNQTVRGALRFFFSSEGQVFREFLLEEIVTVVDASSRDAIQELTKALGLRNVPVPSFIRALNPELSDQDRRMVEQIQKLVQFLLGDYEAALSSPSPGATSSNVSRMQLFMNNRSETNARLRQLIPVLREYSP